MENFDFKGMHSPHSVAFTYKTRQLVSQLR